MIYDVNLKKKLAAGSRLRCARRCAGNMLSPLHQYPTSRDVRGWNIHISGYGQYYHAV